MHFDKRQDKEYVYSRKLDNILSVEDVKQTWLLWIKMTSKRIDSVTLKKATNPAKKFQVELRDKEGK